MDDCWSSSTSVVVIVGSTRTRATSHFLYVPDREAAARAGKALARAGVRSEAGPAAEGDDWLVIATHDEVAERDREVATQEAMREIALSVGGQYNGYCVAEREEAGRSGAAKRGTTTYAVRAK
jgi:hypothetical protein